MLRAVFAASIALCFGLFFDAPAKAQTAEETVAFIVLSLENSSAPQREMKLVQTSPATYDVKGSAGVPSRWIVRALNSCVYHVENVSEGNIAEHTYKSGVGFDVDFTNAAPNGSWLGGNAGPRFKIDGVKLTNCLGTAILDGAPAPKRMLEENNKLSNAVCQSLITNGFEAPHPATPERTNAALKYLHSNFCKGRAF